MIAGRATEAKSLIMDARERHGAVRPTEKGLIMTNIACAFVCANGEKCGGTIYRACAYGPRGKDGVVDEQSVKKYRLFCTLGDDHAGIDKSLTAKERMEFYPDQLPEGVERLLWRGEATHDGKPLLLEA